MKRLGRRFFKILSIIVLILMLKECIVFAEITLPTQSQYMELKLAKITDIDGKDKQVIMEWYVHDMTFKGADVRFEYDSTKLKPSNLNTNEYDYSNNTFQFDGEFQNYMSHKIIADGENVVRMNMALQKDKVLTSPSTSNVIQNDDNTYSVDATGKSILVGRMSFRLFNGKIDDTTFKLKTGSKSPLTGIKINYNGIDSYEEQSAFRFTIASSNAYLKNIQYSICKDLSEELEYTAVEDFDKDTFEYEIILNEYKEYISLIPTLDDEKATIKVKIPKRDDDNKLVYEEKELDENGKINLQLNELGKEDTIIEFIVLAEDGETTNTYKVKVHRPYGTIKGKIQLGDGLRDSMEASYGITTKYIADICVYKQGEFDWDGILGMTSTLDDLSLLDKQSETKSDDEGEFKLYVIPGTYDCILEKLGFLAQVVTEITINENDEIDLGTRVLIEGDVNRSGIIDLDDMIDIVNYSGASLGDGLYDEKYDYGQKGFIGLDDLVSTTANMYNTINIEKYTN